MTKQLARITDTFFGVEDRGFLTFWLYVDYEEGLSQGVGGYALDMHDELSGKRFGTAYGTTMLIRILDTLGVKELKDAKDMDIFVLGEGEGFDFKYSGIQALRADGGKKLIFKDVFEETK